MGISNVFECAYNKNMKAEDKAKLKKQADSDRKRAIDEAKVGEYVSASFHAASALRSYSKLSDSEKIQELKKLVVEYNSKAEPLTGHKIEVPLTKEMQDEFQKLLDSYSSKGTLAENLYHIAKSRTLLPRLAEARKNAKNIRPITAQLATHMQLGDNGHVASYDDFDGTWLNENYGFQVSLTMSILDNATAKLIEKKQLTREALMDILLGKKVYTSDQLIKLDAALERRFEDDYFSAIHILTPLIENLFMHISGLVGLDTITFNGKSTSTRNKNLSSDILSSKEYQDMWGEDFCFLLSFFLYDPTAHRFRHKVAHGDIKMSECNYSTFNMLFYIVLRMTMMVEVNEVEVEV